MSLTYYDYKNESLIGVDTETKDPFLTEKGSGVYRKDGYVCGVSFSNGKLSEYYDIKHPDTKPETREKNLKYIKDQLSTNNQKVFANAIYDLDWLENYEGIKVSGEIHDIQIAEPILDEYKDSYSLDNLSRLYLKDTKLKDPLLEWCEKNNIKLLKKDSPLKHLYKMPASLVNQYGAKDSKLTIDIFKLQLQKLKIQNLMDIYQLEISLFPLLLQMRKQGVRINRQKLNETGLELSDIAFTIQEELNELAEFEVNPNSSKDLEKLFKKFNLKIIYGEPTDLMVLNGIMRGNPRFGKEVLKIYKHPIAKKILELRHIKTLLNLYIIPYPDLMVDNRLHSNFHQLKSDEYGTVSARFSSSNPNLQAVSGKKEEEEIEEYSNPILNGQVIRKLFIPEEGCKWLKYDWSQIEYRLIAHYALGEESDTIRNKYINDPNTDYHEELGKLTNITDRKIVKTLNFGAAYGMGVSKMTATYGWDYDEAVEIYRMYHDRVPFVKETGNRVAQKAKKFGFIRTILNRRARLKSRDKAYIMLNRLIQGSAADLMKKAMVDGYYSGVFDVLFPHITVHDEMDVSIPETKEGTETAMEFKYIMENCIKLKVPIKAEMEIGDNWGEVEKVNNLNEIQQKLF